MWRQINPKAVIDRYKNEIIEIFGHNLHLKTMTTANILQTIGFRFGCYFKIIYVVLYNGKHWDHYHFKHCDCSQSQYSTRLLFTNKLHISHYSYTFMLFKDDIYISINELFGRTIPKAITCGQLLDELPADKNLLFMYSYNENLFCIVNRIQDENYFAVEILSNKYLITPISTPKKVQKLHLSYELIQSHLHVKDSKTQVATSSCLCDINEKQLIKTSPLGKKELMNNIQMLLQSLGLYQLYEPILTFISRLKVISYDIETQTTEFSDTFKTLQNERKNIIESQNILENGAILNKLNILLIGSCTFMSVSSIKNIIWQLSSVRINEDILQKNIKKKLLKSYLLPSFDRDIVNVVEKQYAPDIILFEDVKHFIAHLIRFTRLSEYLEYILLSRLIFYVKEVKEKGMFSLLLCQLYKWIPTHYIFAFNGSNFDNILIEQTISPYFLSVYKSKVKISLLCNGQSCVNLLYSVSKQMFTDSNNTIKVSKYKSEFTNRTQLIFRDTRKIVSRGSLNDLAKVYELPINKLTFPYGFLKNKTFLLNITLDNIFKYEHLFYDILKFKTMTELEKNALKIDFENSKCRNLYEYLKVYLHRDVLLLHKLMNKILDAFNDLDCNIILQRKLTISSIAFSNIYIYENLNNLEFQSLKITTSRFVNETIKNSVIGGYCCTNIANTDINSDFVINDGLTYVNRLSENVWHDIPSSTFDQTCKKVLSYDIRYCFYLLNTMFRTTLFKW